ncbi:hypothetical protein C3Y87_12705 [Carbonactinospora thermoautotrophica]|uniref:N-acetylmuramoyl-L-alanine amidase n=1 Tax=Carbonactinospora thermoautotrophica TaxID=1469144 RepID=UPI0023EF3220|nr:hypothetical protein [Carbonactinospora thermoautotrophica]
MVAHCPFAEARFLPESSTQPRIKPTQIICHTMAGTLSGTDAWFRRGDVGVETHFGIGRGGRLYQWMDTTVRADGNYKANRRPDGTGAISIETEGYASEPWTQAQIDMLVRLHVWLMRTHTSIGRRICRTADDPGLGYHTMFGAPGPWTPVAKDCPGKKRIQQWREVVVPRVLAALKEEDMTADEIAAAVWNAEFGRGDRRVTAGRMLAETREDAHAVREALDALAARVAALEARMNQA